MQGPLAHLSSHTELHKIMQGALRVLQALPTRTCTRLCKDLWRHFARIPTRSSQGPVQDHARASETISPGAPLQGPLQDLGQDDLHARVSKKESYKIFRQEPHKSIPAELSDKHIWDRAFHMHLLDRKDRQYIASARPSCKDFLKFKGFHQDLHKIFSQGPLQDLDPRASIEGTKRTSQARHTRTCYEEILRDLAARTS
jgi:hypothetical protein